MDSESEIPTGNRAIYVRQFRCESCGHRIAAVIDFLKVRDETMVIDGCNIPYEELREL